MKQKKFLELLEFAFLSLQIRIINPGTKSLIILIVILLFLLALIKL